MKKIVLISFLVFGFYSAHSQIVSLNEDKIITKNVTVTGWVFNVCEDIDFAKDDIKRFLKDRYGFKAKKDSKNTSVVPEIVIPNVSSKRGDLLIYIQHSEIGNVMGLAFVLGYDISLNSTNNEKEMGYFRDVTKEFMEYHFHSYYTDVIEDLNKQASSVKKDLLKKENNISSMKKKEGNLDKKLSKEDDEEKKKELDEELEELLTEMESNFDLLPALKEQIESLEEDIDTNKEKLLDFQNHIKRL